LSIQRRRRITFQAHMVAPNTPSHSIQEKSGMAQAKSSFAF
jgi:hypothetical protein